MAGGGTLPRAHDWLAAPGLRRELVRSVARRVDASLVDDVVQATLAEALAARACPETEDEVRRFVHAIARQKIADVYRRRGREERLVRSAPPETTTPPLANATDWIHWAEAELPRAPEAKTTLAWLYRESEGETLAEIAARDLVAPDVVRARVSRLRRHFRARWVAVAALVVGALWTWRATRRPTPPPAIRPELRPAPVPVPTAPFDRRAAQANIRAIGFGRCAALGGPRGGGHASLTFGSTGHVTRVDVDGPFGGTAAGICVETELAKAVVPPFVGDDVRVGTTFTVE